MPEGDTLLRTARVLGRAFEGQVVRTCELHPRWTGLGALVGLTCAGVESRGKYLLIHWDDGTSLLSHLRMTGSWHAYAVREPWTRPARQRSIALATDRAVVVGFNLPVLERLTRARLQRHPRLSALGPDLLSSGLDVAEVVARLRACAERTLGEALLEQRIACGIGNVYKSESLYLCRLDPWARVSQLSDDALATLVTTARRLMQRNLEGNMRRTVARAGQGRYHVYGREGWPCLECSTPIEMQRQGDHARSTYFCPVCQRTTVRGRANVQPAGTRC